MAGAVVATEALIYAGNGWRCPLTSLAGWLATNLAEIISPIFAMRSRSPGKDGGPDPERLRAAARAVVMVRAQLEPITSHVTETAAHGGEGPTR